MSAMKMNSISAKILEVFRNLRTDAVPRAPRSTNDDATEETHHNEREGNYNEPEDFLNGPEINQDSDGSKKKKKPGKKEKENKPKNKTNGSPKINNLNTQAGGTVFNIIDSPKFHLGHDFVYNLGPTTQCEHTKTSEVDNDEENIEETNEITLLREAKISPEHEHIDYISKNLGKKWHRFFRKLGYCQGRIETFEIDQSRNGVSEARYQLLLDWIRNDEDGTLGRLSTVLWYEGERHMVKDLSIIYSTKNCK